MKISQEIVQGFHRKTAQELFNYVWELLDKTERTEKENRIMIHAAHASLFHWLQVGDAENEFIGEWQISRVYSTLNKGESALYHAKISLEVCENNKFTGFNPACAYEALARAHWVLKDRENASNFLRKSVEESKKITDEEEKKLIDGDIENLSTLVNRD
ncbi:hypothetical protein JXA84_05335 [candidate division WOR-3 bacterium]|nr:hypothetical protein [candidate division WOR-3 bacterium]